MLEKFSMKSVCFISGLFVFCTSFCFSAKCDIESIYLAKDVDYGTKAIDDFGNFVEIEKILFPYNEIKEGNYEVMLTRKDNNLYLINGTDMYIETSFCFEFAIMSDAILKIKKYNGRAFGEVIFLE